MTIEEAIRHRHSVRKYLDKPISEDIQRILMKAIEDAVAESGLDIHLAIDEPEAFDCRLAHYGRFSGVKNYISISFGKGMDEMAGYYGERLVLLAETLGLSTCWVALTYRKASVKNARGKDRGIVISIGYGAERGSAHRSKSFDAVAKARCPIPDWFRNGVESALLAPTAINQQRFLFTLIDEHTVKAEARPGFWSKVDLGIVKLHFEIGAGKENFSWK